MGGPYLSPVPTPRITVAEIEQARETVAQQGWSLAPGAFVDPVAGTCCGLSAVAIARGLCTAPDIEAAADRDGDPTEFLAGLLGLPEAYCGGFVCGFDRIKFRGTNGTVDAGYQHGIAAAEAIFESEVLT